MAEAVRFYWRGRDASIPLGEIPEQDRNPLRVRRSVVQSYTPNVVKQLSEDRFVAAAWEDQGSIFLILCHPNIAKDLADAFLVDTRALPRVVLKLGGWDEIPEATRLFLTAFGSEAATVEECAAARQALIRWLTEHGQLEMAKIVKHFSSFPFGIKSDALEVINIWRHVLVKGERDQIDRMLVEVGKRFEGIGWSREATFEALFNRNPHQGNYLHCWVSGKGAPRVLLCLNRATERRVRGGTYDLLDGRTSLLGLAREIQRILTEVLDPAAAEVGLEVSYPRLGPISRVSAKTVVAMTALAEAADGRWPLTTDLEPAWKNFVFTAVRDGVAIKPEEFAEWLVASGWSREAAPAIASQFYTDAARIGEYEEAGRQPA